MRALVAAAALFIFVLSMRDIFGVRRSGGITSGTVLMFAAVVLPSSTNAVGVLTGTRTIGADAFYRRTVQFTGVAEYALRLASPLLALGAVAAILVGLRRGVKPAGSPMAIAGLLVALLVYHQPDVSIASIAVNIALLVAVAFVPPGRGVAVGVSMGAAFLILLAGIAAVMRPEQAFSQCQGSCEWIGTEFSGIADNKNAMGLLLAMVIPFFWFGLASHGRTCALLSLVLVVATGSLTAAIAGVTGLLILNLARGTRPGTPRPPRIAPFACLTAIVGMAVAPLLQLSDASLTGRTALWRIASSQIANRWLLGYGPGTWRSLVDAGSIPLAGGYSTHNQVLEILYVGGLLGACIFGLAMGVLAMRTRDRRMLAAFALPMLIVGITERPWSLGQVDWLSWALPALLACVSSSPYRSGTNGLTRALVDVSPTGRGSSSTSFGNVRQVPRQ